MNTQSADVCQLEVTQEEFDQFSQCEAVIVREYEHADGSRVARVVAWGDMDEMTKQAAIPGIHIVPVGVKLVAQRVVPFSEIIQ